jgi:hypothetical protein
LAPNTEFAPHDRFEFKSLHIKHRPQIVSNLLQVMKEGELKDMKRAKITDPLGVMHRVNEMERIHDGPFLLGLQIVVVEKAQNLLLDLHIVRIK